YERNSQRAYFIPVLCFSLKLSNKYWAPHVKNKLPFDSQVIEDIYQNEILKSNQYLENYLWPNYTPEASTNGYLMSICCIVNEKFRENVPAWEVCIKPFITYFLLQQELKKVPKLQKFWNLIKKNYEKMEPQDTEQAKKERTFLASLIKKFLVVLMSIPAAGKLVYSHQRFCVIFFLELNIIDCIYALLYTVFQIIMHMPFLFVFPNRSV
uniref:RNA helicase aquarius N-terminal domain-containing protein n=1 Tax=Sinocyclocheilus rhinocerous TaxID=307959 RepID=A0A673KBH0_9TELE